MKLNPLELNSQECHITAEAAGDGTTLGNNSPSGRLTCVILLMSHEAALGQNLRNAAEREGRYVIRVEEMREMLSTLRTTQPAAVLLDLDMPDSAAWEAADRLLRETCCLPVLLLTTQTAQFNVQVAIRTGSIIDKSTAPDQLLQIVDQIVASPNSVQAERNAIQRIVVLWLKPESWQVPVNYSYRDWGINE
jgi:DNA-binding response OmpR family regulator